MSKKYALECDIEEPKPGFCVVKAYIVIDGARAKYPVFNGTPFHAKLLLGEHIEFARACSIAQKRMDENDRRSGGRDENPSY